MFRTPRTTIVLVLTLVLSRAPIPWMHDHFATDDGQLTSHLQLCHPDDNGGESPKGWHVHLLPIEMLAGEDTPERADLLLAENVSLRCGPASLVNSSRSSGTLHLAVFGKRRMGQFFGSSRSTHVARTFTQCGMYKLFSVLLL